MQCFMLIQSILNTPVITINDFILETFCEFTLPLHAPTPLEFQEAFSLFLQSCPIWNKTQTDVHEWPFWIMLMVIWGCVFCSKCPSILDFDLKSFGRMIFVCWQLNSLTFSNFYSFHNAICSKDIREILLMTIILMTFVRLKIVLIINALKNGSN